MRTNPIAYYRLQEAACRAGDSSLEVMYVRGISVLAGLRNQLDAAAAQQLFATPQHVKTFISAIASWVKAFVKWLPPWNPPAPGTEEQRKELVCMTYCLGLVLVAAQGHGAGSAGQQEMALCVWRQYYSSMELMLFWWLSRAVLMVSREMVSELECTCSSSSRDSNNSGSIGGSCDLGGSLIIRFGSDAKLLQTSLLMWHTRASQQLPPASDAAAAGATGSQAAMGSGAAAAVGGGPSEQLPMRLSKLPQQGLPEAVVKILQRNSRRWPLGSVESGVALEDKEVELQLLCDVIELCEVLQQEVPCPIGCNNPCCVDLKGVSEVVASGKVCTKCQVARYCSRECQVQHWDVHKPVCKRLQKEAAASSLGKPK